MSVAGNSITGAIGGGATGAILQSVMGSGMDVGAVVGQRAGGGVVLSAVVGMFMKGRHSASH
jgi:hypothetical protein